MAETTRINALTYGGASPPSSIMAERTISSQTGTPNGCFLRQFSASSTSRTQPNMAIRDENPTSVFNPQKIFRSAGQTPCVLDAFLIYIYRTSIYHLREVTSALLISLRKGSHDERATNTHRLYAHRTTGRYCHYCYSGSDPFPRLCPGPRKGARHLLSVQPETAWTLF